ncbi:NAD(P)-binding domain-containing protein [Hyphomicrobium sp. ghe19]|uniref:NAD(P)-binding domain-containing protein n=1 Tax=Hyphomicrobium sp. ghe19 TaxID=2682968 RepID=UPI0030CE9677
MHTPQPGISPPLPEENVPVTIIGAGPYGLSLAAHLRESGTKFRIFGSPMKSWLANMPRGMCLKSTGYSSTLYDPKRAFTIGHYCAERKIPYADIGLPVKVETFCQYAMAFKDRFVPDVHEARLTELSVAGDEFRLRFDDGTHIKSRHVIVGVGLEKFRRMPAELTGCPTAFVSHSGEHTDLRRFRDAVVAVIGAGSSAIDMSTLIHEAGGKPVLVARKQQIEFGIEESLERPLWDRVFRPMSGIGPGWTNYICANYPGVFRQLPDGVRQRTVNTFLGPSGGWFMKERSKAVSRLLGHRIEAADARQGKVHLTLVSDSGDKQILVADHVIAATGYKMDVERLDFLSSDILQRLKVVASTPRLSGDFESSIPGLFFIGPISAMSLGPVMRFAAGAGFTAARLSKLLAKRTASQA